MMNTLLHHGRTRQAHRPSSDAPTSAEVVAALLLLERLRVPAGELRAGDRIVVTRGAVITVDTLTAAVPMRRSGREHMVLIATEHSGHWATNEDDRSCFRLAG